MTPRDVEMIYDALALRLDAVGPDRRELFLAKLALLLAHDLGDAARACNLIAEAANNLDS